MINMGKLRSREICDEEKLEQARHQGERNNSDLGGSVREIRFWRYCEE